MSYTLNTYSVFQLYLNETGKKNSASGLWHLQCEFKGDATTAVLSLLDNIFALFYFACFLKAGQ